MFTLIYSSILFDHIHIVSRAPLQMLLLQGNNYGGGGGGNSNSYGNTATSGGHMYEDDLISRGARGFPLGHGMIPTPQAYSFGFPVHPAHDPMGLSSCKYYFYLSVIILLNKFQLPDLTNNHYFLLIAKKCTLRNLKLL